MGVQQLQEVTAATVSEWCRGGQVELLDVREAVEYAGERIDGAKCCPLSKLDAQALAQQYAQTDKKLVVYCQSGMRSAKAAQQLAEAGLGVYQLTGGINAWKQAGLPVVKSANAPISLFRQVQIVAGSLILTGTVLGFTVNPKWHFLSGFVGAGLVFAGITNTCAMGMLLAKLPYNQRAGQTWS